MFELTISTSLDKQSYINELYKKLLPEIKKFFSDEKIQKEYKEWLKKKQKSNPKT